MTRSIRALGCVFFYVVVCNIPLWFVGWRVGVLEQGTFGLEFIAIGILSMFRGWRWVRWVLFPVILIDILYCIKKTYLLSSQESWLSLSSALLYIKLHPWSMMALFGVAISVAAIPMLFKAEQERTERRRTVWIFAVTALVLVGSDAGRGTVVLLQPDRPRDSILHSIHEDQRGRLMRNFAHRMLMDAIFERRIAKFEATYAGAGRIAGASTRLPGMMTKADAGWPKDVSRPNIVFVLLESWGKPLDRELDDALTSPYLHTGLQKRYAVTKGTVPFHGPTVSGELRELCSTKMGFGVLTASASKLANCLPHRLKDAGYETKAVHGFDASMFDRQHWYRRIGFEETWFLHEFREQGLRECPGPFLGICDADMADWIGERLRTIGTPPQFIYWVTLNSHLPVPVSNGVKDPVPCKGLTELNDDAICAWYRLVFNVHRSVAALAMGQTGRPTVFVIVGDHAPPFASDERREKFSSTVVPYMMLVPKTDSLPFQPMRPVASNHSLDQKHIPMSLAPEDFTRLKQ